MSCVPQFFTSLCMQCCRPFSISVCRQLCIQLVCYLYFVSFCFLQVFSQLCSSFVISSVRYVLRCSILVLSIFRQFDSSVFLQLFSRCFSCFLSVVMYVCMYSVSLQLFRQLVMSLVFLCMYVCIVLLILYVFRFVFSSSCMLSFVSYFFLQLWVVDCFVSYRFRLVVVCVRCFVGYLFFSLVISSVVSLVIEFFLCHYLFTSFVMSLFLYMWNGCRQLVCRSLFLSLCISCMRSFFIYGWFSLRRCVFLSLFVYFVRQLVRSLCYSFMGAGFLSVMFCASFSYFFSYSRFPSLNFVQCVRDVVLSFVIPIDMCSFISLLQVCLYLVRSFVISLLC